MKKIKLYSISHFEEYILICIEKTKESIDLLEKLIEQVGSEFILDEKGRYLNYVDEKTSSIGDYATEIIWGKNKLFLLTSYKDPEARQKLFKILNENTEFFKPKSDN